MTREEAGTTTRKEEQTLTRVEEETVNREEEGTTTREEVKPMPIEEVTTQSRVEEETTARKEEEPMPLEEVTTQTRAEEENPAGEEVTTQTRAEEESPAGEEVTTQTRAEEESPAREEVTTQTREEETMTLEEAETTTRKEEKHMNMREVKTMTREEILAQIREVADKLGHPPTFPQLEDMTPMRRRDIRRHFRCFSGALEESGVGIGGSCRRIPDEVLFEEWATIARKLKKLPSMMQFEDRSKYTVGPYQGRFKHWTRVPEKMREYAETHGLMEEWQDVMELVRRKDEESLAAAADGRPRSVPREPEIRDDRPVYGPLMTPAPMLHEPINELGVVFYFGTVAARLGFMVTLIQAGFPDCEAFRVVAPRRLQRVKVEFELESRNFLKHGHNVNGCDMIVCWEHNWPECPLEVIELRTLLREQLLAASY